MNTGEYIVVAEWGESLAEALDALQDDIGMLDVVAFLGGVSILSCPDNDGVLMFHVAQAVLVHGEDEAA